MQTISERIGDYAATLRFEDIPADVVHQAKRTITDTLGCAFGGHDSPPARIAREMAGLAISSEPATLIYSGEKTSADLAAFANDVATRYLDFNDGYVGKGGGHPSDSIAALLAAAEVCHAGGRDLIVATVLTYDVYCRICDEWSESTCGMDHVTTGGIASVAGVARLFGLTSQQTSEAINIMVAGHIALNQTRIGAVSNWKACAYANANRNAIFAVQLAKRGMTGPSPIFEGRNGFFKIVSRETFDLAPFGGNGRPFGIMKTHLKQFPLGNDAQTVVPAALEARALVKNISEIAEIHIRVRQKALNFMADVPEKWRPPNREAADHSIPYTAGVALMYGTIDHSYFDEQYLRNKELLDLVGRIKCGVSEEANQREREMKLCELDVILHTGERKSVRVEFWRGHWRNPMTDAEIEGKFRALVATMLPAAAVDALLRQLWQLDQLPDVGALIQMTQRNQTAGS